MRTGQDCVRRPAPGAAARRLESGCASLGLSVDHRLRSVAGQLESLHEQQQGTVHAPHTAPPHSRSPVRGVSLRERCCILCVTCANSSRLWPTVQGIEEERAGAAAFRPAQSGSVG